MPRQRQNLAHAGIRRQHGHEQAHRVDFCLATISAFWDRRQQFVNPHDLDENFALEQSRSIKTENILRQIISYVTSYVTILRVMDSRLSALGPKKVLCAL